MVAGREDGRCVVPNTAADRARKPREIGSKNIAMLRIIDNLAPLGGRPLPTGGHLGCGLPPGFHAGTGVCSNAFALVPDPDPDDLYYSSFFVVGGTTTNDCGNNVTEAGETCDPPGPGFSPICQTAEVVGEPCPWDCQVAPDQNVGINDFVDLLGHWGPCP